MCRVTGRSVQKRLCGGNALPRERAAAWKCPPPTLGVRCAPPHRAPSHRPRLGFSRADDASDSGVSSATFTVAHNRAYLYLFTYEHLPTFTAEWPYALSIKADVY